VLKLRTLTGACVSAALLTSCGQNSDLSLARPSSAVRLLRVKMVFKYTGSSQTFVVPSYVTEITVVARGASGAGYESSAGYAIGGLGAGLTAAIPVTPGETLTVYVGGEGQPGGNHGGGGGFNGGGSAGSYAFGGGGSSDVRTAKGRLKDRVVVAAGGGGGGEGWGNYSYSGSSSDCFAGAGGNGGSSGGGSGGNGSCSGSGSGGGGLRQSGGGGGAGGIGRNKYYRCSGASGTGGALLYGGDGSSFCAGSGGGGGAGYYGGGGGGSGDYLEGATSTYSSGYSFGAGGGGGGGGSSYVEKSAKHVVYHPGVWNGNGEVVISWRPS
jgi:hypothetical protein